MKAFLRTLILLALLCPLLSPAEEIGESVLAKVGDTVITSYEVRVASAEEEARLPGTLTQKERMEAVAAIRQETLEALILQELVWMDFQSLKGKIPAELVQERIDTLVLSQANANEELFRDRLHAMNMTYKDFQEKVKRQLAVEMLLYDRTRRNLFVTDGQIREYFQKHQSQFATPLRYRVQVIMLPADGEGQKTCGELQEALAKGADFGELARKHSQGPNRDKGGDLGWLETMAPALKEVVERLTPGEVAPAPLAMGKDIYLVRLADRQGGDSPALTREVQNAIRKILEDQQAAQRLEEYKKTLYTKYPLRRY